MLAAAVLLAHLTPLSSGQTLLLPLLLLMVNLLAAVLLVPGFRVKPYLLGFHLALLFMVIALGWAQLSRYEAAFELVEGERFDGWVDAAEGGLLRDLNQPLPFSIQSESMQLNYGPNHRRDKAINRVSWWDERGEGYQGTISNHVPLTIAGYRIYTSRYRGFSLLLRWQPVSGEVQTARVNLPSYLENSLAQSKQWTIPGTDTEVWAMLGWEGDPFPVDRDFVFTAPEQSHLVLRSGGQRYKLMPGDAVQLPSGSLQFIRPEVWLGYRISYDPTISLLVGTSFMAALLLMLHYIQRFQRRPWFEQS